LSEILKNTERRKADIDAMFAEALRLQQRGQMAAAANLYLAGLATGADDTPWFHNLGYVLRHLGRLDEAAEWFEKGLVLHGDNAGILVGLARVLIQRGNDGAEALLRHAMAAEPNYVSAWRELYKLLRSKGKIADAKALLVEGAQCCTKPASLLVELAGVYINEGRRRKAIEVLERAIAAEPHSGESWWHWLLAPLPIQVADAAERAAALAQFDRHLTQLAASMNADEALIKPLGQDVGVRQPYFLAYIPDNHLKRLSDFGDLTTRAIKTSWPASAIASVPRPGERVRLAVVSQQIRRHSVWDVVLHGLLHYINRSIFAVTLLDTGEKNGDDETIRAHSLAENYVLVGRDAARCHAELVKLKPHVIFYPEVGMDPITFKMAVLRLAALQCVGWGHPITTGLPNMDLYFSGESIEAADADLHYREKLVRLPGTGVCTFPLPLSPGAVKDVYRYQSDSGVVRFFIPQRCFKFDPHDDELIARIVAGAWPCELWLMDDLSYVDVGRAVHARIAAAIEAQGVSEPRSLMRILPWMGREEFLGMLAEADVFLDCPSFSGYTTAWQAVHQGLPVVTLEGAFMRQRLAAGLLRQIGSDDLVAADREQYVAIALALAAEARDPAVRAVRRSALREAAPRADRQKDVVRALERTILDELGAVAAGKNYLANQKEQEMNTTQSITASSAAPKQNGRINLAPAKTPIPWRQLDGTLHMQTLRPDYAPVGLLEMMHPNPAAILDVGCFCGGTGRWLRKKFPSSRLIGLEPLAQAALVARDAYDQLIEQPVESVDFPAEGLAAGSIDAIVAADVLEHMSNPWRALEKLRPLLSAQGAMYVSLPNVRNLTVLLGLVKGEWRYTGSGILDITHLRFFTRTQAIEMFTDTGWHVTESRANPDPRLKDLMPDGSSARGGSIRAANVHLENLSPDDVRDLLTLQHFFRIVPV
jgi:predicted O-linked N-acetylglucosamine transferase (SPINDLY family)/2-polyprenyl-3-methyl-5-hydroxy-6-metoxy-1,4-benzoquinol methylase